MNEALRAELEEASRGLLYVSEGEAPFEYVEFAGAGENDLVPERFLGLIGAPADARIEARSVDSFLAGQAEASDPADAAAQRERGRFVALRERLRERLTDPRVLRVGAVELRCYLVGTVEGGIAGLATTAFES